MRERERYETEKKIYIPLKWAKYILRRPLILPHTIYAFLNVHLVIYTCYKLH